MHAASNVTTEGATYNWLIAGDTVQRQTGRHAAVAPTPSTQIKCRDGRLVNTGAICQPSEFAFLLACVRGLGIEPRLKETKLLELGAALNVPLLMEKVGSCDSTTAIFEAGRAALQCIAATLTAYEFFTRFQRQGIPVGIIYAPEEAFEDEHFRARGFQVPVNHPELGRTFRYPGAPFRMSASPWAILRRAPQLGEHNEEVLGSP
jgi:crotonobetainyl-CoA:carnitine CoA-transferase CaiB-like acyl-CoA transferase